ncbi:MAG: ABC transporter ATP-binding protein [Tetrasphaera sp.]
MPATRPTPTARGPVVSAEAVTKVIGEVTLLPPTSLRAESGQVLVVQGRNGIGKTTLLRILAGVLEPTSGSALIDGQAADERDRRQRGRVAALIGAPAAYRDLTLADHLTLVDATWGREAASCEERVDAALAQVGIGELGGRFPHELSSGQTQLFRLALALFRPSDLLILDEPEQRLDTDKRELIERLLAARRDDGTTLVVACHDPDLTAAIADQVLDLGWEPAAESSRGPDE